ncbi:MAG: helicase HerA-like domain-containing protein [Actinomycetota bacterium]
MDAVDEATRASLIAAGALTARYARDVDRESAHELIAARIGGAAERAEAASGGVPLPPPPPGPMPTEPAGKPARERATEPKAARPKPAKPRPAAQPGTTRAWATP